MIPRPTALFLALVSAGCVDTTPPESLKGITEGLVGWWKLDESDGSSAADSSSTGASGILLGSAHWMSGAAVFDGTDGRIEVAHRPALAFSATESYTVAAWARASGARAGTWRGVVSKSRDQLPHYGIWMSMGDRWTCGAHDGATFRNLESPTLPTPERWYHVACVHDGAAGVRRIYVDGVVQASAPNYAANGAGLLLIGATRGVVQPWAGAVRDVRVYARALGADELVVIVAQR